jgi:hypothetical protein
VWGIFSKIPHEKTKKAPPVCQTVLSLRFQLCQPFVCKGLQGVFAVGFERGRVRKRVFDAQLPILEKSHGVEAE